MSSPNRCRLRSPERRPSERDKTLLQPPSSRRLELGLLLLTLLWVVTPAQSEAQSQANRWAEGRILVQPRAGLAEVELDRVLGRAGGRRIGKLRRLGVRVVQVPPRAEEAVARVLARSPHIEFAELDRLVEPDEMVPNDPRYTSAWHLPRIDAPNAWDIVLGAGVRVAILDTGVDAFHLDLSANVVPGWNSPSRNGDTTDINGHGTKVAGVVAAESDNALGVASVAWLAEIMPVRVTNRSDGWAYFSDIANGLTWAADNGARVANISYDVSGSSTVRNAAQYMKGKGGLVVVAAGNSGGDPGHSASSTLIAVSATGSSDVRASWSSYGSYVDVAAPGVGIWTTTNGGGYGAPSGTSFASPTTAGVVALIMAANGALSPDEVEAVLKNTVNDLGDPDWDPYYGAGRVNAAVAVTLAADVAPGDTDPPSVAINSPQSGSVVTGLVSVDVFATDNFGVSRVELYAGGARVATDTTAPYEFSWDSSKANNGAVILVAHAFDAAGNEGQSDDVSVVVENEGSGDGDTTPPNVTITNPADGSTVSGTVNLSAYATDDVQVSEVRIYVDGALKCAGSPSASCGWNTRKATLGTHAISATAKDTAGNSAAASVGVTVQSKSDNRGKGKGKGGKKK